MSFLLVFWWVGRVRQVVRRFVGPISHQGIDTRGKVADPIL